MAVRNERCCALSAAENEKAKSNPVHESIPTGVPACPNIPKTLMTTHRSIRLVCVLSYLMLLLLCLSPLMVSGETELAEEDPGDSEKLTRIVGGTALSSSVPYFVWLENCGATMIHHDIGLTAAHCATGKNARIGIQSRHDSSGGKTRIQSVTRHPLYDANTFDYDFAVVKFGGWFPDGTVQLNRSDSTPTTGDRLTILGFGGSESLQMGRVSYVHPSVCSMAWGEFGYEIREEIVLCAADRSGADACAGDSGGPLMDGNVQVGVISSGSGCNGLLPTTYARVSAAIGWIENQVCDMSAFPPSYCSGESSSIGTIVRVDIQLDEFPEDIVWRINRDSTLGPTVASGDGYSVGNALESKFVSLQDGEYVFTIEDQSGFADGLGDGGSYKVVEVNSQGNDGKTLVNGGGGFGEIQTESFTVGAPVTSPTVANTTTPTSRPSAALTLNVTSAPAPSPLPSPQPSLRPISPTASPVTSSPTAVETASSDDETIAPSEASDDEMPESTKSPVSPTNNPPKQPETESSLGAPTDPSKDEEMEEEKDETEAAVRIEYSALGMNKGHRRLQVDTSDPVATDSSTLAPTPQPTRAPTFPPTIPSTPRPTPRPSTPAPTVPPTTSPTKVESPNPTLETPSPTVETEEPTEGPTEETDAQTTTTMPSTSPSISVMPSIVPSISVMPSDNPTMFQVPTTDSPSSIPTALPTTEAPSSNPSTLESDAPSLAPSTSITSIAPSQTSSAVPSESNSPSEQPTTSPTTSPAPSVAISQQPSAVSPSPSASPTQSVEPSQSARPSLAPNVTDAPTFSGAPSVIETPSQAPTFLPSAVTTATPSAAPTVPLQRYLIAVSLLIGSEPEEIEWGFYEFDSDEKVFGYPQGWYETDGFSVSTVILKSGTYEFILAGGSDSATAIVEFGILNQQTGGVEEIATVNLGTTTDPEARAVFSLD